MKKTIKGALCRLWQVGSMLGDRLFRKGCDFGAWVDQSEAEFTAEQGNKYQPCNGALNSVLRGCDVRPEDRVLDIGSGKGRAMSIMCRYPFAEVAGIDLSPMLVEIANENFARLGLKHCHAVSADAAVFTDYDRFTYFYLFNSLPEAVFQKAMTNLCASLARRPRPCKLIYLNPVYHDFLLQSTPFTHLRTHPSWSSWFEYRVYEYQPKAADFSTLLQSVS